MPAAADRSDGGPVFRHESGAEIRKCAVGYAAMHGDVRVEGEGQSDRIHLNRSDGIYLNGYYYERTTRSDGRPRPRVDHPWPTVLLSRTDFAEVCDAIERQTSGDPFDRAGVEAGHLYVAYDGDPDSIGRDRDTEERIYAVPEYQRSLIEFPISHLSARGTTDGCYRIDGYNPDGPSANEYRV